MKSGHGTLWLSEVRDHGGPSRFGIERLANVMPEEDPGQVNPCDGLDKVAASCARLLSRDLWANVWAVHFTRGLAAILVTVLHKPAVRYAGAAQDTNPREQMIYECQNYLFYVLIPELRRMVWYTECRGLVWQDVGVRNIHIASVSAPTNEMTSVSPQPCREGLSEFGKFQWCKNTTRCRLETHRQQ